LTSSFLAGYYAPKSNKSDLTHLMTENVGIKIGHLAFKNPADQDQVLRVVF